VRDEDVDWQSREGVASIVLVRDITKIRRVGVGGRHGASLRGRVYESKARFVASEKSVFSIVEHKSPLKIKRLLNSRFLLDTKNAQGRATAPSTCAASQNAVTSGEWRL
jgi:hypothetical protein